MSKAAAPTKPAAAAKRGYRSELRGQQAEQTRRSVVAAAHELFLAKGFAGTGMREVAAAAGVALETVYSHFSSKQGLLRGVMDAAVVGDDAPQRLAQRTEFRAMGEGPRRKRIRAAAGVARAIHHRTAPIAKLLRDGARVDDGIAEMLRETLERQRLDTATAFELVVGRPPTSMERDGVWAVVGPDVYLLLVEGSGWTAEQYEQWMEITLERLLPRS